MVDSNIFVQLGIVAGIFLTGWLAVRLIVYLQRKRTNTELWGTIFEGLTHNTIPQEPLKEPEVFIEKKAKRDGQDKDPMKGKDS